ncbi:MAG: DNA primase [Nanoarchaeota archaeon]|nr:DNA primase [Nanoarchaeota archaeon]
MGKIAPVSTKYIITASIKSTGIVEKPDVIGAIFGQTEGLLGSDLELRELQKSGRIGRIDVKLINRKDKAEGEIIIPSSLNKAETAIIGASIETIERIGPCDSQIAVLKIDDVRVAKRNYIMERAKELLHKMVYDTLPDSKEISETVFKSVRTMEIKEYGPEKLPCGPSVGDSDEVILVEGRADVINLLKHDFRNVISMNGTSVPKSIIELSKIKDVTVFIDGDRGGDLIVTALKRVAEIDFVATAPPGREVEELTNKEIHKSIRAKVPVDQAKFNGNGGYTKTLPVKRTFNTSNPRFKPVQASQTVSKVAPVVKKLASNSKEYSVFKNFSEEIVGSKGAYILDSALQVMGKVPISALNSALNEMESVHAVVLDGELDKVLFESARDAGAKWVVANSSKVSSSRQVRVVTAAEL